MRYRKPKGNTASEMFWDSVYPAGGSHYVECSCGKIWAPDQDLEELEETGNWDDVTSYYYVEMDKRTFVHDCEGCKEKLAKYEHFIWNHREAIRNYLKIRVNEEKRWADQEKMLNDIAGVT